jgi:hypothetical protein
MWLNYKKHDKLIWWIAHPKKNLKSQAQRLKKIKKDKKKIGNRVSTSIKSFLKAHQRSQKKKKKKKCN